MCTVGPRQPYFSHFTNLVSGARISLGQQTRGLQFFCACAECSFLIDNHNVFTQTPEVFSFLFLSHIGENLGY